MKRATMGLLRLLLLLLFAVLALGATPAPTPAPAPAPAPAPPQQRRPLIGVLTQPLGSALRAALQLPAPTVAPAGPPPSYLAASYVKFIEAGGARAVPIRYDAPGAELARLFRAVNALLLPGGSADITSPGSRYAAAGAELLRLAVDAHASGDYFAVHGTCLGLEQLAALLGGGAARVLGNYSGSNMASAVEWTPAAASSRLFGGGGAAAALRSRMAAEPLTFENHERGVPPEALAPGGALAASLRLLAVSRDRDGAPFAAAVEGRALPLSATQFHPEKALFEWAPHLAAPRGDGAAALAHHLAAWLAAEARRSGHAPASDREEDDMLIYNWQPLFTGRRANGSEVHAAASLLESYFDQVYVFPSWEAATATA